MGVQPGRGDVKVEGICSQVLRTVEEAKGVLPGRGDGEVPEPMNEREAEVADTFDTAST